MSKVSFFRGNRRNEGRGVCGTRRNELVMGMGGEGERSGVEGG